MTANSKILNWESSFKKKNEGLRRKKNKKKEFKRKNVKKLRRVESGGLANDKFP